MNSTAQACERLFTLMDNQPSLVRPPTMDEAYRQMWSHGLISGSHERHPYGPVLDAAPVPPPLHPQTSTADSAAL